jgi:hypothetical protein
MTSVARRIGCRKGGLSCSGKHYIPKFIA